MSSSYESIHIPVQFGDDDHSATDFVAQTMTDAREAQARWAKRPLVQRLRLVRDLRRLLAEEAMPLAEASAAVRQRPIAECLGSEVLPLAEACRFLEKNARKILASRRLGWRGRPFWLAGLRAEIHREPLGIVLLIGPGNYPLLLPGVQLIQALVAGNAVLLKPGVGGTAAANALQNLMVRAGFDARLVALLPESPESVRVAIKARPNKVLFTGSANTGEKILGQLSPHVIPSTMELSGCDAVIVRADADLALVTRALVFGLTLNNGATCMSPKRVFVSAACASELEGRLARSFSNLSEARHYGGIGASGLRGPVFSERLGRALDDAVALGARVVAGEISPDGRISVPFVLAGVSPSSRLLKDDIFDPAVALVTVSDDHEAVARANDCPFALAASIFSRDEHAARSLAVEIRAGVVTINDLIVPTADARLPFGGRGRSGFGVTRGAEGLLELTAPKVVTISRGRFRPAFDPPQPGDEAMFNAYLTLAHSRSLKKRLAGLVSLIGSLTHRYESSSRENA